MKYFKMGVLNNAQRYLNMNMKEYIQNFKKLTQTGLKIDLNNNYDIQQKRLSNFAEEVDNADAVTRHQMEVGLSTKPVPTDVMLLNGRNHMTGDMNFRGKKLFMLEKLI